MRRGTVEIPCYILTIDSEGGARRLNATRQLRELGLQEIFVAGYLKSDPGIRAEYNHWMNLLRSKRSLTEGEIAVYCGHRKVWREFLSSGHSHALVLEDDFCVTDAGRMKEAIRDALNHAHVWDILQFFDFRPKRVIECRQLDGTTVVRYKYAASGAVAYLISRKAARQLLRRKRFFRAVDDDFSWPWELDLTVWSVSPNLVTEISHELGGSLLEQERQTRRERRNVLRSLWGNVIQAYKLIRSFIYNLGSKGRTTGGKRTGTVPDQQGTHRTAAVDTSGWRVSGSRSGDVESATHSSFPETVS